MTHDDTDTDGDADVSTDENPTDENPTDGDEPADEHPASRTPGGGAAPEPKPIEPAAPEEFGLVQAWWGDGKGKTTAAMGMGFRAAGHGYRVHMLQLMKGGADSVEGVRSGSMPARGRRGRKGLPGSKWASGHPAGTQWGWQAIETGRVDRRAEQSGPHQSVDPPST